MPFLRSSRRRDERTPDIAAAGPAPETAPRQDLPPAGAHRVHRVVIDLPAEDTDLPERATDVPEPTVSTGPERAATGLPEKATDLPEKATHRPRTADLTDPAGGFTNPVAASATGLSKVYGKGDAEVVALDDVDVAFEQGRFTAVMGPSGSGKSTLMHCVAGLDAPTSGRVFIGDTELGALKDKQLTELRRDRVGFVFQAFNLVPTLTAEENITLPLAIAGRKPDPAWFDQVVETTGLRDRLSHNPTELSGGQQQRVACARALMSRPDIVFADEPTGNLDSTSSAEVLAFLRRSVDEFGQTIVMVTHDAVAASYCDRVVFLADGRIVERLEDPDRDAVLRTMSALDEAVRARRTGAGSAD